MTSLLAYGAYVRSVVALSRKNVGGGVQDLGLFLLRQLLERVSHPAEPSATRVDESS